MTFRQFSIGLDSLLNTRPAGLSGKMTKIKDFVSSVYKKNPSIIKESFGSKRKAAFALYKSLYGACTHEMCFDLMKNC